MKGFLLGFLLFVIALVLFVPLAIWGFIETLIGLFYKKRFFKALNVFGGVFMAMALLIDKMLNVLLQFPANRLLQKNGYEFGNYKDTISKVLGENKKIGTLTKFGTTICRFLHFLDRNHCEKSI